MTSKEWINSLNFRLTFIKGKIDDLEDEYQHYTMVDKCKINEIILKEQIEIYKKIKKDLEILEIIKTKNVDISLIKNCYGPFAYAVYNSYIDEEKNDKLTKKEFDLLKEWLEDVKN